MVIATVAHRYFYTLPLRHSMAQREIQRNHATTNKMRRSTVKRSEKTSKVSTKGRSTRTNTNTHRQPILGLMAIMFITIIAIATQTSSKHIHLGRKPSVVQSCIETARASKTTKSNDRTKTNRPHKSWKRNAHTDRATQRRFEYTTSDQAIDKSVSTKTDSHSIANMTDTYAYNAAGIPLVSGTLQPITIHGGNEYRDPDGNVYAFANDTLRNSAGDEVAQPTPEVAVRAVIAAAVASASAAAPPAATTATTAGATTTTATTTTVAFALSPAHIDRSVINYSTKEGMEMNKQATKSLYPDGKGFNLEPSEKFAFVGKLKARGQKQNWMNYLLTVPINGTAKNFLDHYGEISEADVAAHAQTINATDDRKKQEQQQLYSCVHASLTTAAQQRIALQYSRTLDPNGVPSGLALLKLVLTLSSADTRATTNVYFTKLNSGMQEIMESHGSNIVAFNDEIRLIQSELTARGEDAHKIVPQLFKVYEDVHKGEGKMGRYVELLSNQYTNGTNYTASELMAQVEAKYRELTEADDVQGKDKKDDDATIVALQAQVRAMEAQIQAQGTAPRVTGGRTGSAGDEPNGENSEKRKKQRALRRKLDRTPAPKDGEPKTMDIDGKTYYWCEGGNAHQPKWVAHKPSECRGRQATGVAAPTPTAVSEVATASGAASFLATHYHSDEDEDFAES